MPKKTPDYDNVFKTMKSKHKRLFITVINDIFGKNYPMDIQMDVLPSEGYLSGNETEKGSHEIEEKVSDFLIKIEDQVYLLECQSYDDDSMALRIAEYAFIAARQSADWGIGYASIPIPKFSVIYIKRTDKTPRTTTLSFTFPDGQEVSCEFENVILDELTKEYIVEKRLFPYVPFYIARYEKDLISESNIDNAVKDLKYFRHEMVQMHKKGELSDYEIVDLMGFVNTIITHITNGNENEERLVNIMGGTVIETESERLIRKGIEAGKAEGIEAGKAEGKAEEIVEMGQEFGLDDAAILKRLQEKIGLSLEKAAAYLEQYGKQLV